MSLPSSHRESRAAGHYHQHFPASLAEAYGPRAIAVILSGVDHDGSAALKAIKAAGGMTFAQSNAEFGDRPRHAVKTGHIDFILSPAEIAKALLELPGMKADDRNALR